MSIHIEPRSNPITITGFNKKWITTKTIYDVMSDILNNKTFMDDLNYLFTEPAQFFVSLMAYPFDVKKYFYGSYEAPTARIKLGDKEVTYESKPVSAPVMPNGNYYRTIARINIDRHFNNFLDYAPHTKIELYLPFAGFITLDTNLVMGSSITIALSVDWDFGIGTYYIHKGSSIDTGTLITTTECQLGFELPLGSTNKNEQAKKLLSVGTQLAGGIITNASTGGASLVVAGLNAVQGGFNALQETITKGTSGRGKASLVSPSSVYVIYTRAKPTTNQMDYKPFKGLPLYQKVDRLDFLTGFTTLDDFHLDNFNTATSSEIDKIETLLKSGVIL